MTSKLVTVAYVSPADRRAALERENRLSLLAYRRERGLSVRELSWEFACSADSIERYLTGARPVPGYIVAAMRGRVAA